MDIDISAYEGTLIFAIVVLTYIAKISGVPNKVLPIIAVVLGVVSGLVFIELSSTGALTGILLGAASIGVHSGAKNVLQNQMFGKKEENNEE